MTEAAAIPATETRDDTMPKGIPYIVANEFAERFCYYGNNAILSIYMTQFLRIGDADATTYHSLFKSAAYFSPLLGAIVSDVFWGKFKTILTFSISYCTGCAIVALVPGNVGLIVGLTLVALGTGGIKPCVSTNVGDQFTSKNQHLIERAFSYFYLSINAGSSISIYFCPIWLNAYGPRVAFGVPAAMMLLATVVFGLGRRKFVVVPPAMTHGANRGIVLFLLGLLPVLGISAWIFNVVGPDYRTLAALITLLALLVLVVYLSLNTGLKRALPAELLNWMQEAFTGPALKQITGLALIYYIFIAMFWCLWDQSNGQTWTLQATSDLMDKHLFGFLGGISAFSRLASYQMLPSQIQVVNGLFILAMVPIFTFGVYPLMAKFFTVTPLRKIGIGLFVISASYLIVASIENHIMHGETVSLWWQILAYVVLTAAEVLISITALEFSYKQAPLKVKSFIMAATYLLAVSIGNAFTAQVNGAMVKPLPTISVTTGAETWAALASTQHLQRGQKIDFGGDTGVNFIADDGPAPLEGTFLIGDIDAAHNRVRLMDAIHRQPVVSSGQFDAAHAQVTTYKLVGPNYFLFFAGMGGVIAVLFVFVAGF